MSSSTADPAGEVYAAVCRAYDAALAELQRDDLSALDASLTTAAELLARLPATGSAAAEPARQAARERHARLTAALVQAQERTRNEIGRVRRGRTALRAYGGRGGAGRRPQPPQR